MSIGEIWKTVKPGTTTQIKAPWRRSRNCRMPFALVVQLSVKKVKQNNKKGVLFLLYTYHSISRQLNSVFITLSKSVPQKLSLRIRCVSEGWVGGIGVDRSHDRDERLPAPVGWGNGSLFFFFSFSYFCCCCCLFFFFGFHCQHFLKPVHFFIIPFS